MKTVEQIIAHIQNERDILSEKLTNPYIKMLVRDWYITRLRDLSQLQAFIMDDAADNVENLP